MMTTITSAESEQQRARAPHATDVAARRIAKAADAVDAARAPEAKANACASACAVVEQTLPDARPDDARAILWRAGAALSRIARAFAVLDAVNAMSAMTSLARAAEKCGPSAVDELVAPIAAHAARAELLAELTDTMKNGDGALLCTALVRHAPDRAFAASLAARTAPAIASLNRTAWQAAAYARANASSMPRVSAVGAPSIVEAATSSLRALPALAAAPARTRAIHAALRNEAAGRPTFLVEAGNVASTPTQRASFALALFRAILDVERPSIAHGDVNGVVRALAGAVRVVPSSSLRAALSQVCRALLTIEPIGVASLAYECAAACGDAAHGVDDDNLAEVLRAFGAGLGVAAVSRETIAGLRDIGHVIADASGVRDERVRDLVLARCDDVVGRGPAAGVLASSLLEALRRV